MVVTEAELRDQLRRPTVGARVVVPAGARLSPAAADFVREWSLVTVEGAPDADPPASPDAAGAWDTAATFPLNLSGDVPLCTGCGMPVTDKADALTQLNAHHYAPKTHPRIRLRGRIDSLHALVGLVQHLALRAGEDALARDLGTLAAYCRELTSAEYNERTVAELRLAEWDAEAIHRATHDPVGTLGVQHLTLAGVDAELQHWLNVARTDCREIEILALEAFGSPHHPYGASICHAFNRLSSVLYFLQLRLKAGERL